jgi:hypothetical protein
VEEAAQCLTVGERTRPPGAVSDAPVGDPETREGRVRRLFPRQHRHVWSLYIVKSTIYEVGRDAALRRPDGPAGRPYLAGSRRDATGLRDQGRG